LIKARVLEKSFLFQVDLAVNADEFHVPEDVHVEIDQEDAQFEPTDEYENLLIEDEPVADVIGRFVCIRFRRCF